MAEKDVKTGWHHEHHGHEHLPGEHLPHDAAHMKHHEVCEHHDHEAGHVHEEAREGEVKPLSS